MFQPEEYEKMKNKDKAQQMVNKKKFVGNKSEPLDKAVRQNKKVSDPPPCLIA